MATPAIGKIIAAEGAFIVVAGCTTLRVFAGKVHCRNRRRYLISARRAGSDRVAIGAGKSVTGVAERRFRIGLRRFRNPDESAGLMTRTARSNILLAAFRVRRMTLKTGIMRVQTLWNRERNAVSQRFMTGRAICLPQMFAVIENRVETFQSRKILDRAGFRICMTNRANRTFIVGKLLGMTTRTGNMPDQFRCG